MDQVDRQVDGQVGRQTERLADAPAGVDEREAAEAERSRGDSMASWTQEEKDYWFMGPFDGGMPGMVRRVRRILDVSQRGLAALLGVSQSAVARWETGRTSPRVRVMQRLLRMARVAMTFHDEDTGEPVRPMRADGARSHAGSRYPAHGDLSAADWWVPRRLRAWTSIEAFTWWDHSKRVGDPAIQCRLSPYWKQKHRWLHGTPDDHPAVHQLVAEVRYIDECREDRHRSRRGHPA